MSSIVTLNLTSTTTTDLPAPALPTSPPPPRHVTTDTQHVDIEVSSTMDVPLSPTRSETAQSETPQWMANLKLRSKGNNSHSFEAVSLQITRDLVRVDFPILCMSLRSKTNGLI